MSLYLAVVRRANLWLGIKYFASLIPGISLALCIELVPFIAHAQDVDSTCSYLRHPSLAFEVASVKEEKSQEGLARGMFTFPGGRVEASYLTLQELIQLAFDVQPYQITHLTSWMRESHYEVIGIPPVDSLAHTLNPTSPKMPLVPEQREMLQHLLCDRFSLRIQEQFHNGKILALRTGKVSSALNPTEHPDAPPYFVVIATSDGVGDGAMRARNASMSYIAQRISGFLEFPVIDETGLKGGFDFETVAPDTANADRTDATIEGVKALGLRLVSARGPVRTISVITATKPSPN